MMDFLLAALGILPLALIVALVALALVCTAIEARPRWPRGDEWPRLACAAGAAGLALFNQRHDLADAPVTGALSAVFFAALAWHAVRLWQDWTRDDH